MKPREYCCCAIPIVNAGVYTTLTTQLVTAITVGIVSVATPSIVGAATPSFAAWVLAGVCFLAAVIQFLGFIGVARERPTLFRRYVSLHLISTLAAFAVAAAWAIISATKHSTSKSKCLTDFFADTTSESLSSLGDTMCEIFPWVDVGIMGGLWIVLAILHIYLYVVLSSYGTSQRRDHEKYDQLNNDSIPMNTRNDPWDSRPSLESPRSPEGYRHVRQQSAASISDVLSQPQLQAKDSLSRDEYGYSQAQNPLDRQNTRGGAGARSNDAYGSSHPISHYPDPYYNTSS